MEENYYMPWVRCQPYIVGVGLGYILHHTRNRRVRINRVRSSIELTYQLFKLGIYALCNAFYFLKMYYTLNT